MPILIMALLALGVFLVMGLMLFYAAYKEAHTPHASPESTVKTAVR
jgi:hypothetical protein